MQNLVSREFIIYDRISFSSRAIKINYLSVQSNVVFTFHNYFLCVVNNCWIC